MKKIIIKETFPSDWVTREAGEKLRNLIVDSIMNDEKIEVDFANMTIASVSFFDEGLAKLSLEKKLPKGWIKNLTIANLNEWDQEVLKLVSKERKISIPLSEAPRKSHPWRLCPIGEHYVKAHDKKTKTGKTGHWHAQCRKNPSGKEIYTADEIHEISQRLKDYSVSTPAQFKKTEWNRFDLYISGWTNFWNDIFSPSEKLSPNYVKALIASESSFDIDAQATNSKKDIGKANGLVQLTDQTIRLISSGEKELFDHRFEVSKSEIYEPDINICVAIRWLFRKRELAQDRLKRIPTWFEVLEEYKGILTKTTEESNKQRGILLSRLKELGEKP